MCLYFLFMGFYSFQSRFLYYLHSRRHTNCVLMMSTNASTTELITAWSGDLVQRWTCFDFNGEKIAYFLIKIPLSYFSKINVLSLVNLSV